MKLDLTGFKKDTPAEAIMYFRGEFKFLSNMEPCKVILPAEPDFNLPEFECSSTENGYMAWKTLDPTIRRILSEVDPRYAKEITHREGFPLRKDDSPEGRISIMTNLNRQKYGYQNPELREKLIATGDAPLFEGNIWNDRFWGIDLINGTGGLNQLGQILMKIRHEIIHGR